MLKIFLVENDSAVREEIKGKFDWKDRGFEFCGEAGDGELAFPLIKSARPDIVITDIRMPFMDGLALSRLIRREMPLTEIVVLTEEQNFEYARECVRLGVAGYLLKPVDGGELLAELDSLAERIQERNRQRENSGKYREETEQSLLRDRRELFRRLITGSQSPALLLEAAQALGLELSAVWYNLLLVKIQDHGRTYEERRRIAAEIEDRFLKRMAARAEQILVFDREPEGKALLLKADSAEEMAELQDDVTAGLKETLSAYSGIDCLSGLGRPVNRLGELPGSFEGAGRALARRYLEEKNSALADGGPDQEYGGVGGDGSDIGNISPKQVDRGILREFLKTGRREETSGFLEEYFRVLWDDNAIRSNIFRQYIILDAYFCVADFLEELQIPRTEIAPPDTVPGALQRAEDAAAYVADIVNGAMELRDQAADNRYRDIVRQVKQYIEENYADEELSLNLLAAHVNFSPNHLSMVFSQQTGKTLIRYLTDVRMNRAKELLRCTGKRSSVISAEVGYKDPHYFSYLFKKTQGMTPTQFRTGGNGQSSPGGGQVQ